MEGSFILCFAAMMLFMAPGVKGTGHLSFANNTQVNITRAGCGVSKHCVATPDNCDPAGNAICLFGSAFSTAPMAPNGADVTIQLSGNSSGYIALGLTANATEGTTMLFICAQNSSTNGTFFFRTLQKNNIDGMVTPKETRVTEIRGVVNGTLIQCEFTVLSVNATSTRSSDSSFQILLGSGTVVGDTLGAFKTAKESGLLNLADPMATAPATTPAPTTPAPTTTATTTPAPTTPAPTTTATTTPAPTTTATTTTATPTTAGASSVLHSYALLLLLSVVALSFTHRA